MLENTVGLYRTAVTHNCLVELDESWLPMVVDNNDASNHLGVFVCKHFRLFLCSCRWTSVTTGPLLHIVPSLLSLVIRLKTTTRRIVMLQTGTLPTGQHRITEPHDTIVVSGSLAHRAHEKAHNTAYRLLNKDIVLLAELNCLQELRNVYSQTIMSYAPPQRKSALARAKAVSNAAVAREARQRSTPAPAPHRVVLRVKRKRSDAAVENLLVTTTNDDGGVTLPDRKRRVTIEETLADLSLNQHRNYAADTEVLAGTSIVPPLSTTSHPPQQRLFFKRVRTTESERSRRREGNPAPPAVKAAGAAAASEQATTTSATADGMGAGQAAGGRLDTFAGSNANMSSAVSTASCNIVDYLEVRRIKAKGVPAISTAAAGGGESASRDDDTSQPSSSSRVGSSALEADYHVIDLHPIPREVDGIVMADAGGMVGVGGKRGAPAVAATSNSHAQAAPVLNPVERQMDEAIFKVSCRCRRRGAQPQFFVDVVIFRVRVVERPADAAALVN